MSYILSAFADEAAESLGEQIRICKANDIDFIEMRGVDGKNISEITKNEAYDIRRRLDAAEMCVSGVASPFGKIPITVDDGVFAEHLEKFKRTIEVAHIVGTDKMRIYSFYIPEGAQNETYWPIVEHRMAQFVENADGIRLCHENTKGIYGDTPERCVKLFETFKGSNPYSASVGLVFDPANFVRCGISPKRAYSEIGNRIEYFHIKDALKDSGEICPSGSGHAEIRHLVTVFDQYRNLNRVQTIPVFLSVEPHLTVFSGSQNLGCDGVTQADKVGYADSESAFNAAVFALKRILFESGFRTDAFGGFEKWTK